MNKHCSPFRRPWVRSKYSWRAVRGQILRSCSNSEIVILVDECPGLLVLVWLSSWNWHSDSVRFIAERVIKWIDCPLWPVTSNNNISTFSVRSFSDNSFTGCNVLRQFRTLEASHMSSYFGFGLRVSKTPFINWTTNGWDPKFWQSEIRRMDDNAERAVFRVE